MSSDAIDVRSSLGVFARGAFVLLAGATTALAQGVLASANGDSAGDRLGFSVASAGDLDNDGVADVIVGAPEDDNNGANSGSARVLSGASFAILFGFNGDSAGDRFGQAVAGIGDFNLDGFVDLLVGAPFDDNTGADSGSARVFSGANGAILFTFNGTAAGDHFGIAVAAAGDINHDGRADIVVGSEVANPILGYVRVVAGGSGATLSQIASTTIGFGRAVAGGADWNLDGTSDLVIGATNAIEVRSGSTASLLFSAVGDSIGDDFGRSVSFASNLNGDGVPDLFVGAPLDDNNGADSGSARAFSGASGAILYTVNGDVAGDQLGASVAALLDLDQDSRTDVVAGIPFRDPSTGANAGGFRVYSGATGAALYSVDGLAAGDHLGASVASAGLVNFDLFGDVVAGAPEADVGGVDSGTVTAYTGVCFHTVLTGAGCADSSSGLTPTLTFSGCPYPGLVAGLDTASGPPNGFGIILLGLAGTSIPVFPGCLLLVQPPFVATLFEALSVAGTATVPIIFPSGGVVVYTPAKVHFQVFVQAPAGQISASKDLVLCIQ